MRFVRALSTLMAGLAAMVSAGQASAAMLAGSDALKEWNLIVFNNVSSNSEVEGRSFIGGSLTGNSSNYYMGAENTTSANNTAALTVVGNVDGSAKNSYGNVNVGGNLNVQMNLNGSDVKTVNVGGAITTGQNINGNSYNQNLGNNFTSQLVAQRDLLVSSLGSLSDNLAALTSTGSSVRTGDAQNGVLNFNAATSQNVFNITAAQLADVGQINVTNATGKTTIINVSGTNINLNKSFAGTYSELGQNVIWNFYQATSLSVSNAFYGTVLAPDAAVTLSNFVEGTLVANSVTQNGEVHTGTFQRDLSSVGGSVSAAPEPATWAMLILGFGLVGFSLRRRKTVTAAPTFA